MSVPLISFTPKYYTSYHLPVFAGYLKELIPQLSSNANPGILAFPKLGLIMHLFSKTGTFEKGFGSFAYNLLC